MHSKYSRQREALLDLLQSVSSHPDADWLYAELKKSFPNISLATVYRNLNFLLEKGDIIKISIGSGKEHYDATTKSHCHFVCTECAALLDVEMGTLEMLDRQCEEKNALEVKTHSMIFYGLCQNCKQSACALNKY